MGMLTTFIVALFSTSEPKIAEIRHTAEYGGLLQIRIAADNNRPCGSIHMTPESLDYIITCGRTANRKNGVRMARATPSVRQIETQEKQIGRMQQEAV